MIEVRNLSKFYGAGKKQVRALDDVSFRVPSRQRLAIVGKSGSGKSTLLNLLAGLDRASQGTLQVDGMKLDELDRNELARYRGQGVGVIFQSFQLMPQLSAINNVEVPLILGRMAKKQRRELAMDALSRVGLSDRADHQPYALSGGEQQRVAIARAIVHSPRLMLADEPTGNLDSSNAQEIEALMFEVCEKSDVTFVLVTHNQTLASRFSQRTIRMSDGTIEFDDHPAADSKTTENLTR